MKGQKARLPASFDNAKGQSKAYKQYNIGYKEHQMIMAHIYMSIRKYMEWSYQKKKSDSYSTFFSSSKLLKGLLSSNHMRLHFSKQGPAPYTMLRSYPQKSKQGSVPSSTIQAFEEKLCLACLREGGGLILLEKNAIVALQKKGSNLLLLCQETTYGGALVEQPALVIHTYNGR